MTFQIINLTSSESVKVKGFPAFLQVATQEHVSLNENEVGIIIGKHSQHEKGVGIFGGIVNPSWHGRLTIEFNVFGEFEVRQGDKIAHLVVLK